MRRGAQWGALSGRQSISTAQQSAAVTPGKDAPISEERWGNRLLFAGQRRTHLTGEDKKTNDNKREVAQK